MSGTDSRGLLMFKDLRAGTKFLILCLVSLALTSVATYALLVEKQIAINFARKELVGSKYLALLRPIYVTVLKTQANGDLGDRHGESERDAVDSLSRANAETAGTLHLANDVKALAVSVQNLNSSNAGTAPNDSYLAALKNLRILAARIGDDSNIILDPVLDTYHLGNVVVTRLPMALEEIGQAQLLAQASKSDSVDRKARFIELSTLLRANVDGITNDLTVAQRENADARLKQFVEPAVATLAAKATAYLDALRASIDGGTENVRRADPEYVDAVDSALDAWEITQKQLEQSLVNRIDGLHRQRLLSMLLIGALGTLGLLVAFLTYRDMIVPIKRLAELTNTIRETKNYGLRFNYQSRDEIGRLGSAFNEMLGELEVAREREIMGQAEISRVSRLTTMGAMVASIAHESDSRWPPSWPIHTPGHVGLKERNPISTRRARHWKASLRMGTAPTKSLQASA